MSPPRILIAGIGNIFLGDDAFGVEVAQRLLHLPIPPHVQVKDFGIRGLDLLYALLELSTHDILILIDAVPRQESPPGTLYLLQPDLASLSNLPAALDAHSMDPVKVLSTAIAMGAQFNQVYIVACEPTPGIHYDDGEQPLGMTPAVLASIDGAVQMVLSLIPKLDGQSPHETPSNHQNTEVQTWALSNK